MRTPRKAKGSVLKRRQPELTILLGHLRPSPAGREPGCMPTGSREPSWENMCSPDRAQPLWAHQAPWSPSPSRVLALPEMRPQAGGAAGLLTRCSTRCSRVSGQLPQPCFVVAASPTTRALLAPVALPSSIHPFLPPSPLEDRKDPVLCLQALLISGEGSRIYRKVMIRAAVTIFAQLRQKHPTNPSRRASCKIPDQHTSEWPRQSKLSQRPYSRGAQEMQGPHMTGDLLQEEDAT